MLIDLKDKITDNFYWYEALYQPKWLIHVLPDDGILQNIKLTAEKMEHLRTFFGNRPISVTSWFRCKRYNAEIQGAPGSLHTLGLACDFVIKGLDCYYVQQELIKAIEILQPLRVELLPQSAGWVHIDLKREGPRTFKP